MIDMITNYLDRTKGLLYSGVVEKLSTPSEVYIELTDICNLKCIYCYKKNLNLNCPQFFDVNILRKMLCDLRSATSEPILFVLEGGEPLLHPHFPEIVQCIKSFNYPIDILTNGELLDAVMLEKLLPYLDLQSDEIQISFDGITEMALKNRKNNCQKIIDNIKNLNLHKIYPRINAVVTKHNIESIPAFLDYINKMFIVKSVSLNSVIGRSNMPLRASLDDLKKLATYLEQKNYNFSLFKSLLHHTCDSDTCMEKHEMTNTYYVRCTALTGKICLSTNGDAYPCVFYENKMEPVGSVLKDSILDIWNSEKAYEFREKKIIREKKCAYCSLNNKCTQICAGSLL